MAVDNVIFTKIGPMALGSICTKAILMLPIPKAFRACTYSSSLSDSIWDLAIRYMEGHPVMEKMNIRFHRLWPVMVTRIRTNIIWGNDINISETFMMIPSNQPPL